MKRIIRGAMTSLTLCLVGIAVAVAPGSASISPNPGIEIEAKTAFCGNGPGRCTPQTFQNTNFVEVDLYGFDPRSKQKADAAVIVCAHGAQVMRAIVGPQDLGFDPGTVDGKLKVGKNPTETNDRALGEAEVKVFDATTGDTAKVSGAMISNNATDSRVAGGFEVKMSGPILSAETEQPTGETGTFRCSTKEPTIPNLFGPPAYFESILGETDGDS